jgi:hypothetical protein
MKSASRIAHGMAIIVCIGLLGCSRSDLRDQLIQKNQPMLASPKWDGNDCHIDMYLCPEWIAERRVVLATLPDGNTEKIQLTAAMEDGTQLRLKGRAPNRAGDLYLHVCLAK